MRRVREPHGGLQPHESHLLDQKFLEDAQNMDAFLEILEKRVTCRETPILRWQRMQRLY